MKITAKASNLNYSLLFRIIDLYKETNDIQPGDSIEISLTKSPQLTDYQKEAEELWLENCPGG